VLENKNQLIVERTLITVIPPGNEYWLFPSTTLTSVTV